MIDTPSLNGRPHSDVDAGVGWSMVSTNASHKVDWTEGKGCETDPHSGSLQVTREPQTASAIDALDSPKGKKRKVDEEQMASLRDTTFCDSTVDDAGKEVDGSSSAKKGRFNAMRTTAGVPAEGAGLRGKDVPVDEHVHGQIGVPASQDYQGAASLLPGTQRKLCIRHQQMADEGTTAKMQRVSAWAWYGGVCNLLAPVVLFFHEQGWMLERCKGASLGLLLLQRT